MSATNIVVARFGTTKNTQTRNLWQYDYGQILQFVGLDLPAAYIVHFSNSQFSGEAKTMIGNEDGVDIPDEYLETGATVYAWIYLHAGEDDGETVYMVTIPVKSRPRPTEDEPTPVQQGVIDAAIAALNSGVAEVEQIANDIPQTIDNALQEAKDSGEFDGEDGYTPIKGVDYFDGEDGYTPVKGVDYFDGEDGEDGYTPVKGVDYFDGDDGATFTPAVSQEGIISWTNDAGLPNPPSVNIKGPQGDPGSGAEVYICSSSEYDPETRVPTVQNPETNTFYLVPAESATSPDMFIEWIFVNNAWEKFGSATVDVPVQSVNGKTGAVVLTASDVGAGTYSKPSGGIPASDLAPGVIPTVPVQSVNGQTGAVVLDAQDIGAYEKPVAGIPKTDLASDVQTSLGKADTALQSAPVTSVNSKTGAVVLTPSDIGAGTYSKPSGGIPASDLAAGVIPTVPVQDVQVNGTSILNQGVADVPVANTASKLGVVKVVSGNGILSTGEGIIYIKAATSGHIKSAQSAFQPIVASNQHESTFYGLAKAAGDTTQSSSSNSVGTYTNAAKSAISEMLNGSVTVSGTAPVITALPGIQYVCDEVATLSFTPSATGICDVVFTSGSTAAVLTVPSTVKWPDWFNPNSLDANATYELNVMDGVYGAVGVWI